MDNCFTGWRDQSRQMSEKDVLYTLPARPVTKCAFARWRIILSSSLDIVTSSHLFWSVQTCFLQREVFVVLQRTLSFFGQKRGTCGHVMTLFDSHKQCARCREKGVGDDPCVKKMDCQICKAFTPVQIQQLSTPTYKSRKE